MINEIVTVFLAGLWLVTGRGFNLCSVILAYYLAYLAITKLTLDTVLIYYACQMGLDAVVVYVCCTLVYRHRQALPLGYAIVALSSLYCDGLKLLDEVTGSYVLSVIHEFRQELSVPLDVFFAAVGSHGRNPFLYTGRRTVYTKHVVNIRDVEADG